MDDLQKLLDSDDTWVSTRARMAIDISENYKAGNLSEEEYKELLQDLIRTDEIDSQSSDMALKALLVTGVMGLTSLL